MPRSRYFSFLDALWPRTPAPRRRPETRRLRLEPLEERRLLAVLTIAQENLLAGTPASQWDIDGAGDANIQGYAARMSVNHGERIDFKVDTDASDYRLDVYRVGYYGGMGARKVATIQPSVGLPQNQPDPIINVNTGLVDAGTWRVSASWDVPLDATSGVYIAKLVREDGAFGESHIIFVVRDDEGQSDLLFQTSDTTWQAYNDYGGASLYGSVYGSYGRAVEVSYNRPFNTRGVQPINYFFGAEYPMVRFLESNGYNVSYTTGVDTDMRGSELLEHKAFLSLGHDEYWSGQQRDNVEAARDAGVNLAFFSGNEVFWKTRWENSRDASATPYRTLVCYKETHANAKIDPLPDVWTGTWRDPRFMATTDGGNPENALTGTIFSVNGDGSLGGSINVSAADAALRFWRNTAVANLTGNQTLALGDYVLGYEWDEDIDNGFRPAGLIRMSSSTYNVSSYIQDYGSTYAPGPATHHLVMYRAASGALVFGAGTIQWMWGLDGSHDVISSTPDVRMQQATVNLFADMGAQATTLRSGLVQTTQSTDLARPVSTITAPLPGAILAAGVAYTVAGTAQDTGGGIVAAVEVSVDGGATWHLATGRTSWTYTFTPRTSGQLTIRSRAVDDSANLELPKPGVIVNPTSNPGIYSLWSSANAPGTVDSGDYQAAELGVKIRSDNDGFITALRFYKSAANTGTHTASLWTASGQLLATATFTNETASGWQQVNFASPVAVQAGVVYVASYHTNSGGYSVNRSYFTSLGVDNGPLHAVATGVAGSNGVYRYGASAFPTLSFSASNYWLDVVLNTATVADTTPPTVTSVTPANSATGVATTATMNVVFNEAMTASTIGASTLLLRTAAGASVAATVSYNATTRTATVTPTSALASGTSYTLTITGGSAGVKDLAGNALAADVSSSFTTSSSSATPVSLWSNSTTPGAADSGDASSLDLGVRFQANANGFITGLKFYKSAANTGTHTGSLWSASGQLLATGTFTNETASGWQTLTFASPVAITAGTTYVTSYHTNSGHYAVNRNYFASQFTSGPLTVPANGGVYVYGAGGFPNQTYQSSNYWVDPLFVVGTPPPPPPPPVDTTPPTVTSVTPANSATGVATSATMSVVFNEAMTASTIGSSTLLLRTAAGASVAATVSYNATTRTATVTPTSALASGISYTLTITGGSAGVKDSAGNALAADVSSSFTTSSSSATPVSLWSNSTMPATADSGDASSLELGVRFQANANGSITGLKFYKSAANTGTHTGSLWSSSGQLLATGTFTNETAGGWQTLTFATPVAITAGTTYVTSYHTNTGHYAVNRNYFASQYTSGPLTVLANGGVYLYGAGGFPSQTYQSSNYWVDPLFIAGTPPPPPVDTTPPTVTSVTPVNNATGVATSATMSVVFSEAMTASTIGSSTLLLRTAAGASVAATVSYNATTRTATVTPTSALASATAYTLTVMGGSAGVKDSAGNALVADVSSSFTTSSTSATPVSLWSNSTTPGSADSGDGSSLELGVQFRANTNGFITGLKFYKSAANTGTHTGSLWGSSGQLLATGTFTNETASGWQALTFATPVAITAGTTYVTSYHTNSGHYAVNRNYFASQYTSGPLTVLANGGVFLYGAGGFPNSSYQSSNYWVDPLFVAVG